MKKMLLITIALFSLSINAQDLIVGENTNDGVTVDLITNQDVCSDNSIRVEIDFKKSNVKIVNFGEIRNYKIGKIEFQGDGYYEMDCTSEEYQDIHIFVSDLNIAIVYSESLMVFAENLMVEFELKKLGIFKPN